LELIDSGCPRGLIGCVACDASAVALKPDASSGDTLSRLRAELAAVFEGFEEAKLARVPNIGSFRLTTVDDVDQLRTR
jgi:hypothetical protein